ncbi:hypothetical protein DFR52_10277 [Hoeflea marina]|uniref:Uncharacterized protein n=1 Tax=Hoeflea marina TaxID=274592 RepID=A0A317PKV3_9HYPH|nr:hypothetical protein [Hoeflea marina]PWW01416.1 hypothetical protein DFR52_10277 [Hoeflea marina]
MNKFTTFVAAAAIALTSTAAFAASTAMDGDTYWSSADNMDPSVYDMMINPETKAMREDDDFAKRMSMATDEEKTKFGAACSEWQQNEVLFTDKVAARCKM